MLGHCYPTMDAPAIGRVAALDAGLPVTATGIQIDRRCGSGLQAVLYAAILAVLRFPSPGAQPGRRPGPDASRAQRTKALCPVTALPTMRVFISRVPSNENSASASAR